MRLLSVNWELSGRTISQTFPILGTITPEIKKVAKLLNATKERSEEISVQNPDEVMVIMDGAVIDWAPLIEKAKKAQNEFRIYLEENPPPRHDGVDRNPDLLHFNWFASWEEMEGANDDPGEVTLLRTAQIGEDGASVWHVLDHKKDPRVLSRFSPREAGDIEFGLGDPVRSLWWNAEDVEDFEAQVKKRPFHSIPGEVNWEHVVLQAHFREQKMFELFWEIKGAKTVVSLTEVAREARKQARASILRDQGILRDKKGILPIGLDSFRYMRVMNAAAKKAAHLLQCPVENLGYPFKLYEIVEQSTKKSQSVPETKSEDALDQPRTGFFHAEIQPIPGIGEKLSELLEQEFGSLEAAARASFSRLQEIKGIGPKRALAIREAGLYLNPPKRAEYRQKDLGRPILTYRSPEGTEDLLGSQRDVPIQSFRMSDAEVIAWQGHLGL